MGVLGRGDGEEGGCVTALGRKSGVYEYGLYDLRGTREPELEFVRSMAANSRKFSHSVFL